MEKNRFIPSILNWTRYTAISATAMKLAVIIWNMITRRIPYTPPTTYEFLNQKRKRKVQEMKKLIHKFDIMPTDLGLQLNINNL
jgi:transposase